MRIEHWLYSLPLRLRSLFLRRRVEQELNEELQYHLQMKTDEYIAQGLTPRNARHAALRAMDGLTQRREECRDMRHVNVVDNTIQDLRYGLRVLAKSPAFTAVAVLTLMLAIGANAVVFGVLNALILRPLSLPQSQSLYAVETDDTALGSQSYPDYVDLRDRNRTFDGLGVFSISQLVLDTGKDPLRLWSYETSGNYFDALRIQPFLGRFFHRSDEHGPDSAPYIVLTWDYWQSRFHGDRGVIGRVVRLNQHSFTIIGVAPPAFHGSLLFFSPDIFVPIVNHDQLEGGNLINARGIRFTFGAIGHLKPGVTTAEAVADLNSIAAYLERTYPKEDGHKRFSLIRAGLPSMLGRPARAFVTGLMLLAALILLAACANLGSLFAARAADRSREIALRLALGSTRQRILRQLLTEAVLISLAGGAAGLLASVALLQRLSAWQPFPNVPVRVPVTPDANVYVVAVVLAVVSGLLFGIAPVRQVFRTDPYQIVKSGSAGAIGRRVTVRDLLLGVQVAICAVLVTSSMVAVRGLIRSLHSDFGFEPQNTMLADPDFKQAGYTGDKVAVVERRMIDAMETIPGVAAVGLVNFPPLGRGGSWMTSVFRGDATDLRPSRIAASAFMYVISPGYFRAAGTHLLAGRTFSWHDDSKAPPVAIVNREFAARILGSVTNGVGRYYKVQDGTRIQVVGIVENGKYLGLTEAQQPATFLPIPQQQPLSSVWLLVRSPGDSDRLAAAMRSKLRELDPALPFDIETWNRELDFTLFPSRVATVALGVLGSMGAMLSVTGIFGLAAYSVSRRKRELGIRIALGAARKEVLRTALGRAVRLLAFGSIAGLILGILGSRVLAAIVYHATQRDPLVLTVVVLFMALLGLLATWIPAQRALSIDPMTLLREE